MSTEHAPQTDQAQTETPVSQARGELARLVETSEIGGLRELPQIIASVLVTDEDSIDADGTNETDRVVFVYNREGGAEQWAVSYGGRDNYYVVKHGTSVVARFNVRDLTRMT